MISRALMIALVALLADGSTACAGEIAAVVEDVSSDDLAVRQMDLLEEGQIVELPASERVVLGYLLSCVRETITGGRITIGTEESTVKGGARETEELDCDGGRAIRASNSAAEIAGAVFRKGSEDKSLPKPDWTLFGLSPVFRLSITTRSIKIERLDKEAQAIDLAADGGWVDAQTAGVTLEASGLYAISTAEKTFVLKVSPLAEESAPFLSRFVPM